MAMKDMALTKAEAKDMASCEPAEGGEDLPKYPYGLTLYLDDDVLAKLGMSGPLPAPGTELMLSAKVKVTGTSSRETLDGEPEQCLDIQITAMDLMASMTDGQAQAAKAIYPSKA